MKNKNGARHLHAADLHGVARLALGAIEIVLDQAEALHGRVLRVRALRAVGSITGFAFRQLRHGTATATRWSDLRLADGGSGAPLSTAEREAVLAAVNGLFGDQLSDAGNPLAIRMRLRADGTPLALEKPALAASIDKPQAKIVVLVHGLCRCDLQWRRAGHDHGQALAHDLGYSALYLHYNSGRHISTNGREFSDLMEQLVAAWPVPVEQVAILGHSMGGLVARSACYYAKEQGHAWLRRLEHMVFLGTPHQGAPLERHGNWLGGVMGRSTLTAPLARLGQLRSAGITDLRYGNLVDQDWQGRDRFEHGEDLRLPVPLPKGVRCYAVAGTTGRRLGDIRDRLLGDGVIPLDTALGVHHDPARTLRFPKTRQFVAFGIHHLDLLSRAEVYDRIRHWLGAAPRK
ncbi:MAG TPA: alpha/beta hydrolase [Telluria sp.]